MKRQDQDSYTRIQQQATAKPVGPGKAARKLRRLKSGTRSSLWLRVFRRFAMPGVGATLMFYGRYEAFVSPRAEVDLSPGLHVGRDTRISSFVKIKVADGPVYIGERCGIASGTFISSGAAGTHIGDDCLIGPNCVIVSSSYRYDKLDVPLERQGRSSRGTYIGNNVFLGSNCSVVDGAVIEDNVVIGAQSLVSGKIPRNTIAQGNPARVAFARR